MLLENDRPLTTRRGGELTTVITAGAIGRTNGLPPQLFFHTSLEGADGRPFASGTTIRRYEQARDAPAQRMGVPSPLLRISGCRDLPLETWLAVEAVRLGAPTPSLDPETLEGVVVFYLYLSTKDGTAPPATPVFRTWKGIR